MSDEEAAADATEHFPRDENRNIAYKMFLCGSGHGRASERVKIQDEIKLKGEGFSLAMQTLEHERARSAKLVEASKVLLENLKTYETCTLIEYPTIKRELSTYRQAIADYERGAEPMMELKPEFCTCKKCGSPYGMIDRDCCFNCI